MKTLTANAGNNILNSDQDIVNRVLEGNKDDFEILIRRFNQQLFRIGMAYLKNEDDAQDAMQSTYLKAYEKLSRFKAQSAFSTWLVRIMINECLQLKRLINRKELDSDVNQMPDINMNGVQKLMQDEMKELFENAITTLPRKYRVIYMFRAINEYSVKETAQYLEISEENVKVRFHRSKQMLKEYLLNKVGSRESFVFLGKRCDIITNRVMKLILNKG